MTRVAELPANACGGNVSRVRWWEAVTGRSAPCLQSRTCLRFGETVLGQAQAKKLPGADARKTAYWDV